MEETKESRKRLLKWSCGFCGSTQESEIRRWEMSYCKCRKSAVDLEVEYSRFIGKVKIEK